MPRKDYMGEVYDVCRKLKNIEDTQKELKEEDRELKDQLRAALIGHLKGISSKKLIEEASTLYWNCEVYCHITKQAYREVSGKMLKPTLEKLYPDCLSCGDQFEVEHKSWDEQKRWRRWYNEVAKKNSAGGSLFRYPDCHCERCCEQSEQEFKRYREEREREEQEREEQEEIQTLKTMPYPEYLQTEHWKRTRLRALRRADFACQLCNRTKNLQTHHRTYERRGCELPADLIVLCRSCHEKHHDIISEWSEE